MSSYELPWDKDVVLNSLHIYRPDWAEHSKLFKRYMLGEAVRSEDFSSPLSCMFDWQHSPRGFEYWRNKAETYTLFTDLPLLDQIWIHHVALEAM